MPGIWCPTKDSSLHDLADEIRIPFGQKCGRRVSLHTRGMRSKTDRSHWPIQVVSSFEQADEVDFAFYESLTAQQRLDMMVELVGLLQHGATTGLERIHRVPKGE